MILGKKKESEYEKKLKIRKIREQEDVQKMNEMKKGKKGMETYSEERNIFRRTYWLICVPNFHKQGFYVNFQIWNIEH